MAIVQLSTVFNGTRRCRTIFNGALAAAAFTSTSFYVITAIDGGTNPINVVAVFAIASNPNAVEFAIDADLTSGALYTIGYTAVPGADASTFTGTVQIRNGLALVSLPNEEQETDDVALLLYGRDLVFSGYDWAEDATGDLLLGSGRSNWKGAIDRRLGSQGLNWDPSYGPRADQQVDAPSPYAPSFAGSLVAQARLDDRTKQATAQLTQAPGDPNGFIVSVQIVGRDGLEVMSTSVPLPTG
jgi:hypothetical protein